MFTGPKASMKEIDERQLWEAGKVKALLGPRYDGSDVLSKA